MKTCGKFSVKSFLLGVLACLNYALPLTLLMSMNVLFPDWLTYFQADRGATSAVQATLAGVTLGAGLIGGVLIHRIGDRGSLLLGAGLSFLGLLTGSYAPSLPTLVLCVGVITGCGFCLVHLGTLSVAMRRFPERAGFLSCLMSAMAGLFHLGTPLLYRYLNEQFTWRGTLLTASAVSLHTAIFSLVLTSPLLQHPTSTITNSNTNTNNTTTTITNSNTTSSTTITTNNTNTTTESLQNLPSNSYICDHPGVYESTTTTATISAISWRPISEEETAKLRARTVGAFSKESDTALSSKEALPTMGVCTVSTTDTIANGPSTRNATGGVASSSLQTQDTDQYPSSPKVPKHAMRSSAMNIANGSEFINKTESGGANHCRTYSGYDSDKELTSGAAYNEAYLPDEPCFVDPDVKTLSKGSDMKAENPETEQTRYLPAEAATAQPYENKMEDIEVEFDISQEKRRSEFDDIETNQQQQQQQQRQRRTRRDSDGIEEMRVSDTDITKYDNQIKSSRKRTLNGTERRRVSETNFDADITTISNNAPPPPSSSNRRTLRQRLRAKTGFLCSPLYITAALSTVVVISTLFSFVLLVLDFADHKGWTEEDGVLLNFVFMLSSLCSRAVAGVVSLHARVRNTAVLIGSGVVGSVGLTLIGQVDTVPLAVACYSVMGVSFGVNVGMFPAVVMDITGPEVYPLSLGLLCTCMGVMEAAMGILAGTLVDKLQSYTVISLSYGLLSLATCILLLVVFLTRGK